MGAAITGWGSALPDTELHNEELAARLGIDADWIVRRTGIHSRRVVSSPSETTSSLATAACRAALRHAEVDPAQVDLVIVATMTPDSPMPSTASLVQDALGATTAGAFDLNAACAGFLYALPVAQAMVDAKLCRRVVVCGADVMSRITDHSDPKSAVLFGDGAAALVIEHAGGPSRLGPFTLSSDGSKSDLLSVTPGRGVIQMQGREVYRHATEGMTVAVREVLADARLAIGDVDLVVAHQANLRILEAVAERLGLMPEQLFVDIAERGNTSAASIPLALAQAATSGRLRDGDLVVVTAFGGGFAWGAGVLRWGTSVSSHADRTLASVADA
jgi:3-oxoacyl-[acyl-carrier-protein] synthase-3